MNPALLHKNESIVPHPLGEVSRGRNIGSLAPEGEETTLGWQE